MSATIQRIKNLNKFPIEEPSISVSQDISSENEEKEVSSDFVSETQEQKLAKNLMDSDEEEY